MEIILTNDVDKLGKAGQALKVKDGYARNFLFPRGLAVVSTPANLKKLEADRQKKLQENQKSKTAAGEIKGKLEALSLTIAALTHEGDKLYGSITAQEISAALNDEGFEIGEDAIVLEEPIKALGIFEALVNLHPEVSSKIKIWVVKK